MQLLTDINIYPIQTGSLLEVPGIV